MVYRILAVIAACILTVSTAFATEKPVVLTTVTMIQDMAQNIFGDKADVKCFVPIGGDPHLFEPTPNSAKLANQADLVLFNGLALEGKWLEKLIDNSGTKAKTVAVTKGISSFTEVGNTAAKDPHAWMSAKNGVMYAENILAAAKELRPEDAAYFQANFDKYKTILEETDRYIETEIQKIPKAYRMLVTSHDAFEYYGKRYGVELHATMGTSTEADVQTGDLINLQKLIKKTGVPAIFVESTVNPKLIKQIAKDNGIKVGGKLYADSLGDEESGANTYVKMLRYNTNTIVNALNNPVKVKTEEVTNEKGETSWSSIYWLVGLITVLLLAFLFLRKKKK